MPLGKPLLATGGRGTWDLSCRVMAQARPVPLRLLHQTARAPASSLLLLNVTCDAAVQPELVASVSIAAQWTAASFASNSFSRTVNVASCQCKPICMAQCKGSACA